MYLIIGDRQLIQEQHLGFFCQNLTCKLLYFLKQICQLNQNLICFNYQSITLLSFPVLRNSLLFYTIIITFIAMTRNYSKVTDEKRQQLIEMINNGMTIKDAAKSIDVKYENAKAIFRVYRKESRTDKRRNRLRFKAQSAAVVVSNANTKDVGESLTKNSKRRSKTRKGHVKKQVFIATMQSRSKTDKNNAVNYYDGEHINSDISMDDQSEDESSFSQSEDNMGGVCDEQLIQNMTSMQDQPKSTLNQIAKFSNKSNQIVMDAKIKIKSISPDGSATLNTNCLIKINSNVQKPSQIEETKNDAHQTSSKSLQKNVISLDEHQNQAEVNRFSSSTMSIVQNKFLQNDADHKKKVVGQDNFNPSMGGETVRLVLGSKASQLAAMQLLDLQESYRQSQPSEQDTNRIQSEYQRIVASQNLESQQNLHQQELLAAQNLKLKLQQKSNTIIESKTSVAALKSADPPTSQPNLATPFIFKNSNNIQKIQKNEANSRQPFNEASAQSAKSVRAEPNKAQVINSRQESSSTSHLLAVQRPAHVGAQQIIQTMEQPSGIKNSSISSTPILQHDETAQSNLAYQSSAQHQQPQIQTQQATIKQMAGASSQDTPNQTQLIPTSSMYQHQHDQSYQKLMLQQMSNIAQNTPVRDCASRSHDNSGLIMPFQQLGKLSQEMIEFRQNLEISKGIQQQSQQPQQKIYPQTTTQQQLIQQLSSSEQRQQHPQHVVSDAAQHHLFQSMQQAMPNQQKTFPINDVKMRKSSSQNVIPQDMNIEEDKTNNAVAQKQQTPQIAVMPVIQPQSTPQYLGHKVAVSPPPIQSQFANHPIFNFGGQSRISELFKMPHENIQQLMAASGGIVSQNHSQNFSKTAQAQQPVVVGAVTTSPSGSTPTKSNQMNISQQQIQQQSQRFSNNISQQQMRQQDSGNLLSGNFIHLTQHLGGGAEEVSNQYVVANGLVGAVTSGALVENLRHPESQRLSMLQNNINFVYDAIEPIFHQKAEDLQVFQVNSDKVNNLTTPSKNQNFSSYNGTRQLTGGLVQYMDGPKQTAYKLSQCFPAVSYDAPRSSSYNFPMVSSSNSHSSLQKSDQLQKINDQSSNQRQNAQKQDKNNLINQEKTKRAKSDPKTEIPTTLDLRLDSNMLQSDGVIVTNQVDKSSKNTFRLPYMAYQQNAQQNEQLSLRHVQVRSNQSIQQGNLDKITSEVLELTKKSISEDQQSLSKGPDLGKTQPQLYKNNAVEDLDQEASQNVHQAKERPQKTSRSGDFDQISKVDQNTDQLYSDKSQSIRTFPRIPQNQPKQSSPEDKPQDAQMVETDQLTPQKGNQLQQQLNQVSKLSKKEPSRLQIATEDYVNQPGGVKLDEGNNFTLKRPIQNSPDIQQQEENNNEKQCCEDSLVAKEHKVMTTKYASENNQQLRGPCGSNSFHLPAEMGIEKKGNSSLVNKVSSELKDNQDMEGRFALIQSHQSIQRKSHNLEQLLDEEMEHKESNSSSDSSDSSYSAASDDHQASNQNKEQKQQQQQKLAKLNDATQQADFTKIISQINNAPQIHPIIGQKLSEKTPKMTYSKNDQAQNNQLHQLHQPHQNTSAQPLIVDNFQQLTSGAAPSPHPQQKLATDADFMSTQQQQRENVQLFPQSQSASRSLSADRVSQQQQQLQQQQQNQQFIIQQQINSQNCSPLC